jgi:hypothetical protein
VVYGVWNYIKNSGKFPDAENLTLEWVGQIPGKRESRRFEGDYMMIQQDIVEQRHHYDAISFGGWSIDLHPADGVFSERPGCDQWHAKGVYQVPYRTQYSKNIKNLFITGRIMSASHVAFGSTRVMLTLASAAQSVGVAAAQCIARNLLPSDLAGEDNIKLLQRDLQRVGQYIPQFKLEDDENLVMQATVSASSKFCLDSLPDDGPKLQDFPSYAQMIPMQAGKMPKVSITVDIAEATQLEVELRTSSKVFNQSPDVTLKTCIFDLDAGNNQTVTINFDTSIDEARYVFVCVMRNPHVTLHLSNQRVTGLMTVYQRREQFPPSDIGVEIFEFWVPPRRPEGHNIAMTFNPPVNGFDPSNVINGTSRPVSSANAWVADVDDDTPALNIRWAIPQEINKMTLMFDTDWDHAMETSLRGHPEDVMPFTVKHYRVKDNSGDVIAEVEDNHQTVNHLTFEKPIETDQLQIEVVSSHGAIPASIFSVQCYT